jgi:hypothetical protein
MDTSINEQGKHLIDLCIESKIRILNSRVMGDSLGSFTYYCTQGKSCIDYIVVSEDIVNSFNFLHVLPSPTATENPLKPLDGRGISDYIFVSCSVRTFISLSGSFTCNKKYSIAWSSLSTQNLPGIVVNNFNFLNVLPPNELSDRSLHYLV